jgi:hypothetical protein
MDNSQKQTLKEIMMTLKSQTLDQLSTYNCPDVAFKISCADIVMSDCYMAHFYIGNKFEQFNYMAPVQTKLFTILDDMFIKKGGFEGGSDDTCVGKKLNAFHP